MKRPTGGSAKGTDRSERDVEILLEVTIRLVAALTTDADQSMPCENLTRTLMLSTNIQNGLLLLVALALVLPCTSFDIVNLLH